MLLYVNDNEGILFIKSVEVNVQPTPPTQRVGGSAGGGPAFLPGYSFEEQLTVLDDSKRAKQEEELLLLMRIFTKVCPNS